MGYCEDTCEHLTSRHNCKKYHKGLTYCGIDIGSIAASYHERCSECEKDHWIREHEKELEKYRWHKVADGDLPPEPKCEDDVKRYLTAQKSIRGPYYINDITKYYGNLPCAEPNLWWWQEHCVAWMELPEYKEEQDKQ